MPPPLAREVIDRLTTYHWPENVRELENIVERALILKKGEPLTFDDLIAPKPDRESFLADGAGHGALKLNEVMSQHIRRVLVMTRGKVHGKGGAAEMLKDWAQGKDLNEIAKKNLETF